LFEHWAFYNETEHQIDALAEFAEDGSEPQASHAVQLRALDLTVEFEPGDNLNGNFPQVRPQYDAAETPGTGANTAPVWTDSQQWFGCCSANCNHRRQLA